VFNQLTKVADMLMKRLLHKPAK